MNFMQKYYQERENRLNNSVTWFRDNADSLLDLGVSVVFAEYDGQGDSGFFEQIYTETPGSPELDIPITPPGHMMEKMPRGRVTDGVATLRAVIEELAYDVLEAKHNGWEIDQGSFGQVVFDARSGAIRIEHNHRIEFTEYEETRL